MFGVGTPFGTGDGEGDDAGRWVGVGVGVGVGVDGGVPGAGFTVKVKVWVALGETPLLAVSVTT